MLTGRARLSVGLALLTVAGINAAGLWGIAGARRAVAGEARRLFRADTETVPVEDARIVQGFVEQSNVSPVTEMARMVEVQRAYEYGQKLLDQEDARIRLVVRVLGEQR